MAKKQGERKEDMQHRRRIGFPAPLPLSLNDKNRGGDKGGGPKIPSSSAFRYKGRGKRERKYSFCVISYQ